MKIVDRTPPSLRGSAVQRVQRTCVECGTAFVVPYHIAHRYSTCSSACSRSNRTTIKPTGICEVCGSRMVLRRAEQRFCSNPCRLAHLNSLPRPRLVGFHGGSVTPKGYIRGWAWDADGRRSVMEHRWVMEQRLGRRLTTAERVHHINGDRTDNRLENLELYGTHSEHIHEGHTPARSEVRYARRLLVAGFARAGWKQSKIARALGVSDATISNDLREFGLRARADHRARSA